MTDERVDRLNVPNVLLKLDHPGIVRVLEVGSTGDADFVAMELLEGKPLASLPGDGTLSRSRALEILLQLIDAVEYIHREGVIHGGIAPSNVYVLSSGRAVLLGFGSAKLVSEAKKTLDPTVRAEQVSAWTRADIAAVAALASDLLSVDLGADRIRSLSDLRSRIAALGASEFTRQPGGSLEAPVIAVSPSDARQIADELQRPDSDSPSRIGRFLVSAILSTGERSRVYLAFDPDLGGRPVAIKLVRTEQSNGRSATADSAGSRMTRTEAAALLNLHPGSPGVEVRRAYEELFTDAQLRFTNAPTPALRNLYERRLRELDEARAALSRVEEDLPNLPTIELAHTSGGPAQSASQLEPKRHLDENVQFTVYRPGKVRPAKWYSLLAFAHLSDRAPDADEAEPDPVEEVQRQARQVLGDELDQFNSVTQDSTQAVPREGTLSFVPFVSGVEFNPPSRQFVWTESVHREEFRFRVSPDLNGRTARGGLSVYLGSILIAEVPLALRVDESAAGAKPETSAARPYRNIFASYSHRDVAVVEEFEAYASALGDRYLRDVVHLRAGENWNSRLMEFIDQADVFQLFWSRNAMASRFVRQEWEYALSLNRPKFVRPVFWETPFPESDGLPSEQLRSIHFARISAGGRAANEVTSKNSATQPPPPAMAEAIPRARSEPHVASRSMTASKKKVRLKSGAGALVRFMLAVLILALALIAYLMIGRAR